MIRSFVVVAVGSALCLGPAAASAQEGEGAPTAPAPRTPRPFNMADLEPSKTIGGELSYTMFSFSGTDGSSMELGIIGEFEVSPNIEIFGRLPWAHGSISAGGESLGDDAIGNVVVGARYLVSGGGNVVLGLGATGYLPTAEDVDFGSGSDFATLTGVLSQIVRDPARWYPDSAGFRPTVSARMNMGNAFFQGDFSMLMLFYTGDQDLDDEQVNVLQAAAGGGARVTPEISVIGELVAVIDAFDEGLGEDDDVFYAIDVGGRYDIGKISIGAHFYFPLNGDLRDQDQLGFTFDVFGDL